MDLACVLTIAGILLVCVPKFSLQQTCSSGDDLGQTECVLITLPSYDTHQWATCVTEDYMKRASSGRYSCYLDTDTQCWYQCMLEIYNAVGGSVNDECRCTPGEMLPNNKSRLPAECYSPGDTCEWYEDCLEKHYSCRGTDDGYAIEYALKFCNLFTHNSGDFSDSGQRWIGKVRECLQVELVPALRLWVNYTCADIRRLGFASHPGCYTNVSPSICELGCVDVIKAFVIVNFPDGDFTEGSLVRAPLETINQMLSVMLKCYSNDELSGCINNLLTTLEITVIGHNPILRTATATFVLARHFARALHWEENGFGWFPLYNDDDSSDHKKRQITDEEINIRVLLVDIKLLNISNGTVPQSNSRQTLNQAVDDLVTAVNSGSLSMIPLNVNNTQVMSSLMVISQCMDVNCNSTNMTELVTAPPNNSGAGCMQWRLYIYTTWLLSTLCLLLLY